MKKPGLRALVVHQPWAAMIALGLKPVEIRPRQTHHRGELAIVAGQTWSQAGGLSPVVRAQWTGPLCEGAPGLEAGGVVALVDVVGCHEATPLFRLDGSVGVCCEPWAHPMYGGWHWELGKVRRLNPLVRCNGRQNIFILSQTIEDAVRAGL